MSIFDYTDQERSLYEVIGWAMLGLIDTVNPNRPDTFSGFLDDLYLDGRGSDIAGEPGWTLERIDLKDLEADRFSPISTDLKKELFTLSRSGEQEAFWLENINANPRTCLLTSESFWKVALDSVEEFVRNNLGNEENLKLAKRKYPKLNRSN